MSKDNKPQVRNVYDFIEALKDEGMELFHDDKKKAYCQFQNQGRLEIWPMDSAEFALFLKREWYHYTGRGMTAEQQRSIAGTLEAMALFNSGQCNVNLRMAQVEDGLELDLNNKAGECVRISQDGWTIQQPESKFLRPSDMQEIPQPVKGGDINKLWQYVNVSEEDRVLVLGWLLWSFMPTGPFPLLILQGEQNSAKSTTMTHLKQLVDPARNVRKGLSKGEKEIFYATQINWIMSFDNLQSMRGDISDVFCRIATGGAYEEKRLYVNGSLYSIEACRPVILNGIDDIATRADLESRAIVLTLPKLISRKSMNELTDGFKQDRAEILGALLDAVVHALKGWRDAKIPNTEIRFTDCLKWMTAAEQNLGFETGTFVESYVGNIKAAKLQNLTTDAVAVYIMRMLHNQKGEEWVGNATQLQEAIEKTFSTNGHGTPIRPAGYWPKTLKALTGHLSSIAPLLLEVGVEYEKQKRTGKMRPIVLRKLPHFDVTSVIGVTDEDETQSHFDKEPSFEM